MRTSLRFIVFIALAVVSLGYSTEALAGAQDTGALASCEMARTAGVPILGTATAVVHLDGITEAAFRMVAPTQGWKVIVLRALVGVDIGTSPMEIACQILHGETAAGGPTLAEQIAAAAGLPNRTIKITKRGTLGCSTPPCDPGLVGINFALIPGSENFPVPATSALGDVLLFAVRD